MIPVTPRTSRHLCDWCKEYQFNGTVPQPAPIRFAIGVYQITQGMSWPIANPVRWQSFCAASMHFIMCGYAHGIDLESSFPERFDEITTTFSGWETVLLRLGKAQQQVVYGLHSAAISTRASRYKPEILAERLHGLVQECFACTPPEYREQGCFDEMKILCGDLEKRKT